MAQTGRKRPAAATAATQSRSKKAKPHERKDDEHEAITSAGQGRVPAVVDDELEGEGDGNEVLVDGDENSTPSIAHRELESDITALIRNSGRNDGWPAAFKSHVGDREGELVERVRTRVADLEQSEASFKTGFLAFLAGCLAPVGVRPPDPHLPLRLADPSPAEQPLYRKSSILVEESRALLSQYGALADLSIDTTARDRLVATLEREEAAIADAIQAGRRVARADIGALLGYGGGRGGAGGAAVEEPGQQGSNVLRLGAQEARVRAGGRGEGGNGGREGERWGRVAAETVRAFARISRVAGSAD